MKTKMIILLTAATLTASLALAQGGGPRQAQGSRKGQQTRDRQRDPAACASYCPQADTCPKAAWGAGQGQKKGGPMSPEMRGQMRAEHRAIRNLGRAACAETDPAKKEELIAQLRAKILEVDHAHDPGIEDHEAGKLDRDVLAFAQHRGRGQRSAREVGDGIGWVLAHVLTPG